LSLFPTVRDAEQKAQIRSAGVIDGRRHRDDKEIRCAQIIRILGEVQFLTGEVRRSQLFRPIVAGSKFLDSTRADVECNHSGAGARERRRNRQPDIPQADNGNSSMVRHFRSNSMAAVIYAIL
jgi:hypothetical protein